MRDPEDGGSYLEGETFQEEAEAYGKALAAAFAEAGLRFSRSARVQAHLMQKHLILLDSHSTDLFGKGRSLSHEKLSGLKLPDEQQHLETISRCLRSRQKMSRVFCCHSLFLPLFAYLAEACLQQHGSAALAYAEDVDNHSKITQVLRVHRREHGCNPSLEQLFVLLLGNPEQQEAWLTPSSEIKDEETESAKLARQPALKRSQPYSAGHTEGKTRRKGPKPAPAPDKNGAKCPPAICGGSSSSSSKPRWKLPPAGTAGPASGHEPAKRQRTRVS